MDSPHGGPLASVLHDLQHIFGERLDAVVSYGQPGASPAPSLALVRAITADDLAACAARAAAWRRAGCATPLLLTRDEFAGSLDAFPIEYGEIIETHHVLFGGNPFAGLEIRDEDLRRACEVQVKSHLLHLRENFIECGGRPADIAALIADASRRPGLDARVVGDIMALANNPDGAGVDAARLYPAYLANVEKLWRFVDRWRATAAQ
jgi:hypothetical protein